jgi:hypothetical protein
MAVALIVARGRLAHADWLPASETALSRSPASAATIRATAVLRRAFSMAGHDLEDFTGFVAVLKTSQQPTPAVAAASQPLDAPV